MALVPVRGLAAKGILRDPAPYQLDLDAWSAGANVRFHANRAERAPIFRTVADALTVPPVFCVGLQPSTGHDTVMLFHDDGTLSQYASGAVNDVTSGGWTPATDPRAVTATFLGDVIYVNRPDAAPRYFGPLSTTFENLPNMETTWTCRSLRAWGDYLIALNVTKPATWTDPHTGNIVAGGALPNLVKWSDLTLDGQVPGSWDPFDPTTSAAENPLEELTTPLVDGVPMRSVFVIYSENEIWVAEEVDSNDIFHFRRLFSDGGLIAPNCAVEVAGVHYCLGPNDIYRHDGVTKQSIVDKRNRDTIFRWLNKSKSEVSFVSYIPRLNSVYFGYNTGDPDAAFQALDRCNQAAVYDIAGDTWSFIDLPNVSAISLANLDTTLTYATAGTLTYAAAGGSYLDQENTYSKNPVVCSSAASGLFTNSRLLAYDFMNKGELALPFVAECNASAYAERTGLDLDQLGSDLASYKLVRRVYPLVEMFGGVPVSISVGGSLTPTAAADYATPITFDPTTGYKVDVMKGGRYLAIRFTVDTPADFEIGGFDLDVTANGSR